MTLARALPPDLATYEEQCCEGNVDVELRVLMNGAGEAPPPPTEYFYKFGLSADSLATHEELGFTPPSVPNMMSAEGLTVSTRRLPLKGAAAPVAGADEAALVEADGTRTPPLVPPEGQCWVVADIGGDDYRYGDPIELRQGDIAHSEGIGFACEKGDFLKVLLMERSEIDPFKKRGLAAMRGGAERLRGGALSAGDRPPPLALPDDTPKDPKGVSELNDKGERWKAEDKVGDEEDGRTLCVDYDELGRRYENFGNFTTEMTQEPLDRRDIDGTSWLSRLLTHTEQRHGDPEKWLVGFLRENSMAKTDRVTHELRAIVKSLHLFATHGQIILPSLAGAERLGRGLAVTIDAHNGQAAPKWKLANVYEGVSSGLEAVEPGLRSWVIRRYRDEHDSYVTRSKALSGNVAAEEGDGDTGGDAGGGRGRGRGQGRGDGRGAARVGRGAPAEKP